MLNWLEKQVYPKYFGELGFKRVHILDFLSEKLNEGAIGFAESAEKIVTYHDPCRLGRLAGIYDAPRNIAIVQGHPDDDDAHLLSGLIFGVNAAIIALKKTENLQVHLISPLCPSFQEKFFSTAQNVQGLRMVPGSPMSVEKGDDARPLLLKYSNNGEEHQQVYDLIVVLTKPKISSEQGVLLKTLC